MSTDMVGKKINGYEIIRVLGRGGMGVVYKAHEMTLQRVVALKVLPTHLAENKEFIQRFYREARAAARLNHPNVVTIHRVGEDDGYHYIAMEYLKGKEVTDVIKERKQIPVREAMEIAGQVASALAAAHELGILHRDIKPQNIMIDEAGRVKVMDFGIAKMNEGTGPTHALTMTGQLLGTPAYMSPEQCMGVASDHRSDIYSLGVALYQMLAGRVPFSGETPLAVIRKIVEDPVPEIYSFRQDVPDSAVRILHKSLAKNVDERYQSAADMEKDIRRFLAGEEVSAAAVVRDLSAGPATPDSEGATMVGGSAYTHGGGNTAAIGTTRSLKRSSRAPLYFLGVAALAVAGAGGFAAFKKSRAGASSDGGTEVASVVPASGAPTGGTAPGPETVATPGDTAVAVATIEPGRETPDAPPTPTPEPNLPPEVSIELSAKSAEEGEPLKAKFVYSDPEADELTLAYAVDNPSGYRTAQFDEIDLGGYGVGKHTLYFRARDPFNDEDVAEAEFEIKAKKVVAAATPAKTPREVAMAKPADTPMTTPIRTPPPATPPPTTPVPATPAPAPVSAAPSGSGFLYTVGQHDMGVKAVAFSPDGKRVVSGGEDKKAVIWDVASQKQIAALAPKGGVTSAAFSPDGAAVLTGDLSGVATVWSASGDKQREFAGHPKQFSGGPNEIVAVGFAQGGKLALSASKDGTICVWETGTTSELRRISSAGGGVNAVAFSRDGRFVLTAASDDKSLRVWDTGSGQEVRKFDPGLKFAVATYGAAFSPDGRQAATGGQDKTIWIWDVATGGVVRKIQGHEGWVTALGYSPDGRLLMSGDRNAVLILWDAETGARLEEFRNHTKTIFSIAFSPDSGRAVTGSGDATVRAFGVPN